MKRGKLMLLGVALAAIALGAAIYWYPRIGLAFDRAALEAEVAQEIWSARRTKLQEDCASIIAAVEARARSQLGDSDAPIRRERAELFMDRETGEPAVIGQIRHGAAYWPARYAAVAGRVIAEYDRYSRPELNDLWVAASAGNESICTLY